MSEAIDMNSRRVRTIVSTVLAIAACVYGSSSYAEPAATPASAVAASSTSDLRLPASLPLIRETDAQHGSGEARWAALLVLVALAGAGTVFVRRSRTRRQGAGRGSGPFGWTAMSANKPARVVQSLRLTPKASAHVVQWQGREWLIACTDQALTVLGQEPASSPASPSGPGSEAA